MVPPPARLVDEEARATALARDASTTRETRA
jgi:hypothetical protein